MRITKCLVYGAFIFLGATRPAHAVGVVLGAEPTQVRVAVAPAPDRTTRWESLTVSGTQPFVWIVPVQRDAAIDVVSSAWLEALDVTSAPRIASSCGGSAIQTVRAIELGNINALPKVAILQSASDIDGTLVGWYVAPELRAQLTSLLDTSDLAVVRADAPTPMTIRIVDRDTAPVVPMSLLHSPRDVDVTAFVLSDTRASMGVDAGNPTNLFWFGSTSNYVLVRDGLLAQSGPGGFVTETALPSSVLANQRVSPAVVPSLALEYFSNSATYGEATGSLASCLNAAGAQGANVQKPLCARADVAGMAVTPCATASGLTCGPHADDLALAMSGRAPENVWITRFAGRIGANETAPDLPITSPGGDAVGLLRVAGNKCKPPSAGSTNSGGGTDNGGGGGGGSGGGCSGSVGGSSSSDSSGGGDSCSSDTSSPGDSSSDDCDSGGSSGGGEDCGSGGGGGEDCDSGGGGGGDCGGGGGGGDCAEATPRKQARAGKSPVSRIALSAALLLLPIRRISRRRKPLRSAK